MRNKNYFCLFPVCILLFISMNLYAQNLAGGPTDKKIETPPTPDEIAKMREAIEANPNDLKLHQQYVKAVGIDAPEFKQQYEAWIKKFPQSVTTVFAFAEAYYNKERAEATPYLLKVVEMDPKRGDVYEMLAIDACRWGDYPANARYEKMATEADPTNFTFARHYALALKGRDHGEWKQLCRDVEQRFAGTDNASQALGLIGIFSDDPKEKEAIFLEQMKKYPADKFPSTKNSIAWLASLYIATAPAKSVALYKEMMADPAMEKSTKDYYQRSLNYAEAFVAGQELINKGQYNEALDALAKVKVGRNDNVEATTKLALMKADALDHTGNTAAAYDSLLKGLSLKPSDELLESVKTYGKKLGKSAKEIDADKWKLIDATSKAAPDFDLYAYLQKKNISLADLKGKTVFLTFWFPGCGPCRSEMVHLEPVVKKINDKNFVYIGINGLTEQDPYVESFMKKTGFSFTPLQDIGEKVAKTYGVRGYPTNFIIDQNGKIVYTGFMIGNPKEERMLELMIRSVLDRKG
jgi:peroxiredoxin